MRCVFSSIFFPILFNKKFLDYHLTMAICCIPYLFWFLDINSVWKKSLLIQLGNNEIRIENWFTNLKHFRVVLYFWYLFRFQLLFQQTKIVVFLRRWIKGISWYITLNKDRKCDGIFWRNQTDRSKCNTNSFPYCDWNWSIMKTKIVCTRAKFTICDAMFGDIYHRFYYMECARNRKK